jgi:hypothetical protein
MSLIHTCEQCVGMGQKIFPIHLVVEQIETVARLFLRLYKVTATARTLASPAVSLELKAVICKCLCGTHAGPDALAYDLPFHFCEGSRQMEQKSRHGAFRAGVDALGRAEEPDAERDQFLDTANTMRYTTSPAIQVSRRGRPRTGASGRPRAAVELWTACTSAGEARIDVFCKHLPAALLDILAQFVKLHLAALVNGADPCIDRDSHGWDRARPMTIGSSRPLPSPIERSFIGEITWTLWLRGTP